MALELEILIPEKKILEMSVDSILIETLSGQIGVLPGHCNLLTALNSGVLIYRQNGKEAKVAVHFGYAEVCDDKVTILAKLAELSMHIDIDRSRIAYQKTKDKLKTAHNGDKTQSLLEAKLKRAITRQHTL